MAMSFIKSAWESGNLVFRNKSTGAIICSISPQGVRETLTPVDLDAQNGTLLAATVVSGILVMTSAVAGGTLTLDTAANYVAAFPGIQTGEVVKCYVINDGNQTVTLAADGGGTCTLADSGQTIAADEAALILIRITGAATATVYSVGA